jgi:hypothetical protein
MMASSWPSPSTCTERKVARLVDAIHAGNGICYRFDALANGFGLFRGMAVTAEVHGRNFSQFISPVSEPTVPGAIIVKTGCEEPGGGPESG